MASMPAFSDVRAAARRLRGRAQRTPIFTSRTLDARAGLQVYLKGENFQRTGSFKYRGAYNAISRLSDAEKARGVVTHSSGNHAQAVALVCRDLGIRAAVVMVSTASPMKRQAALAYGAAIHEYDPAAGDPYVITPALAAEHGWALIEPFNHPHTLAGQGTAALELLEDVPDLDLLLAPCGGGGLLSGSALAARGMSASCRVIGVEPETADDAARSFRTGTLHENVNPPTIADGISTARLGSLTFPLIRELVSDFAAVSEQAIMEAVRFLFHRLKIVVEPAGAVGVAALMSGQYAGAGKAGVILSGGNIDAEVMARILNGSL
jgi:threonine dehydratase